MRGLIGSIYGLGILVLSACGGSGERSFTADVLQGLSENGMAYMRKARDNGDFQRILTEIAGGNGLLIDNVYLMRPALDEHEQDAVRQALSQALVRRPLKVLALMPAQYRYEELCSLPADIEQQEGFVDQAVNSISELQSVMIARQQQQCISLLQQTTAAVAS